MGTLHKHKGRWVVDFRLPRFLANKYQCKRFRRSYEKQAVAKDVHEIVSHAIANRDKDGKLAELLDQVEPGITMQKFYDRWIKEYCVPRLEPSTVKRYKLSFVGILACCDSLPLKEFTRAHMYGFVQGRKGIVSDSTINKDIIAVKKMFSYAYEIGAVDNNPLSRFPTLRVQEKVRRIPTIEQFHQLVDAMEDPAIGAMVAVMGECGLRRSEAINLEWKNVNLRTARITVEKTKGKRVRVVPLSQYAVQTLHGLIRFIKQPYVFCHQITGSRWLSPDKSYRAGRNKIGLDWVTFHTLRHMRGTLWIKHGASIEDVKEGLGHQDIRTTDIYARHVKAEAESALREAQKIEAKVQKRDKEKNEIL